MENLTIQQIRSFLEAAKLPYKSTHHRLSIPVINRIYKKMSFGIRFSNIKVCDDLIIDGHHRYISSLLAGVDIETSKSHTTSATLEYDWLKVDFVESEWDRPEEIRYWNELDAVCNEIPIETILDLIK